MIPGMAYLKQFFQSMGRTLPIGNGRANMTMHDENFNNVMDGIGTGSGSALSRQVGGSHYKDYVIQPYEFFIKNKIPHHKAAIIRRILRYDHPTGKGVEDLDKIVHEVELIKEIEGWE